MKIFHAITLEETLKLPCVPEKIEASVLEPYISTRALSLHYDKHHRGYVSKVLSLVGDSHRQESLADIMVEAHKNNHRALTNNAAQAFNHIHFWWSMDSCGGFDMLQESQYARLRELFEKSWGSVEKCRDAFFEQGVSHFGSGWIWLVQNSDGSLEWRTYSNEKNPLLCDHDVRILLVCDLWEHAYYPDHENRRLDFLMCFWNHLASWDVALKYLKI